MLLKFTNKLIEEVGHLPLHVPISLHCHIVQIRAKQFLMIINECRWITKGHYVHRDLRKMFITLVVMTYNLSTFTIFIIIIVISYYFQSIIELLQQ